jgi:hypothetical protein
MSRYVPNEANCPVDVGLLALLLRSDATRLAEILQGLPLSQRAALAAFCYSRCHMRDLSFQIASSCDEKSLRTAAGSIGEALLLSSRNSAAFDIESRPAKRGITLARFAA